jgi:hypothetical protein
MRRMRAGNCSREVYGDAEDGATGPSEWNTFRRANRPASGGCWGLGRPAPIHRSIRRLLGDANSRRWLGSGGVDDHPGQDTRGSSEPVTTQRLGTNEGSDIPFPACRAARIGSGSAVQPRAQLEQTREPDNDAGQSHRQVPEGDRPVRSHPYMGCALCPGEPTRNGKTPSVSAGQPGCGAPRRNRTGDPILTMEPPRTAVRTPVFPAHARP